MREAVSSLVKVVAIWIAVSGSRTLAEGEVMPSERPRVEVRSFVKDGRAWLRGPITSRLAYETRSLKPRETMKELLLSLGIVPDDEALTLVYELNPSLGPENDIGGRAITVPRLGAEAEVQKALKAGYRASLVTDADLKHVLATRVKHLLTLQDKVKGPLSQRAQTPDHALRYQQSIEEITIALGKINARVQNRTVPAELLLQLTAEAGILEEDLSRLLDPGSRIDDKDLRTAADIDEDLLVRLNSLTPVRGRSTPRIAKVNVRVSIRSTGNKLPVSNLRIHYTPVALLGREDSSFPNPTRDSGPTPAHALLEADYFFWAADPFSAERKSDLIRVAVRCKVPPDDTPIELCVP